jgi:hypothetical protein
VRPAKKGPQMVSGGAPRGSSATVDWGAVRGDLADLARQRKADVFVVVVVDRDALGRLQRVGVEDATVSTGSCAEAAIGESNVANPTAAATRMPVVTRLVLRMKPSSSAHPRAPLDHPAPASPRPATSCPIEHPCQTVTLVWRTPLPDVIPPRLPRCIYGGGQRVWPLRRLSCVNAKLASPRLITPVIIQRPADTWSSPRAPAFSRYVRLVR